MKLIKKVLSCSLAVSVALGGTCAQYTKAEPRRQNSGGISQNAKKGIIAGASVVGGAGVVYGIFRLCKCLCNRPSIYEQSVLIVGGTPESRDKIAKMFTGELASSVHTEHNNHQFIEQLNKEIVCWKMNKHFLDDEVENVLQKKPIHWTIENCDINAEGPSIAERATSKTLVIAILNDKKTLDDLKTSFNNDADYLLWAVIDENYAINENEENNTFAKVFAKANPKSNSYNARCLIRVRGSDARQTYLQITKTFDHCDTTYFWNSTSTDGERFYRMM